MQKSQVEGNIKDNSETSETRLPLASLAIMLAIAKHSTDSGGEGAFMGAFVVVMAISLGA